MRGKIRHDLADTVEAFLIKLRQPDFNFPLMVVYMDARKLPHRASAPQKPTPPPPPPPIHEKIKENQEND